MDPSLSAYFVPLRISLRFLGVSIDCPEESKRSKEDPTNRRKIVDYGLTLFNAIILAVPVCLQIMFLFIFLPLNLNTGRIDILKTLNTARYTVERLQRLLFFIILFVERRSLGQLAITLASILRSLSLGKEDHIELRRCLRWLFIFITITLVLFCVIPETVLQVQKASTLPLFPPPSGKTINSTVTGVDFSWFLRISGDSPLLYHFFARFFSGLHGGVLLSVVNGLLALFIVSLTQLVRFQARNADDLNQRMSEMQSGTAQKKTVEDDAFYIAVLLFRKQSRMLINYATNMSRIFGPVLLCIEGGNLVMVFGTFGWIFDSSLLLREPLLNFGWLLFLLFRQALVMWLCVRSTEMVQTSRKYNLYEFYNNVNNIGIIGIKSQVE